MIYTSPYYDEITPKIIQFLHIIFGTLFVILLFYLFISNIRFFPQLYKLIMFNFI